VRSILRGKNLASGENGGKTLAIMNSGPVHPRLCEIIPEAGKERLRNKFKGKQKHQLIKGK